MADTPLSNVGETSLPPEDRVTYDRPCAKCGYNLIGLPKQALCPECGLPVAESLGRRLFFRSSPRYLRRVTAGAVAVEVCTIGLWVTHCVAPLAFGLVALLAIAWWWAAPDPPGGPGAREIRSAARRVRLWAVAGFIAGVLGARIASLTMTATTTLGPGLLGHWAWRVGLLSLAAVAISGMSRAGTLLAGELAIRLNDASLTRACRRASRLAFLWGPGIVAIPLALTPGPLRGELWTSAMVMLTIAGWAITTDLVGLTTRLRSAMWDERSVLREGQPGDSDALH